MTTSILIFKKPAPGWPSVRVGDDLRVGNTPVGKVVRYEEQTGFVYVTWHDDIELGSLASTIRV